MPSEDILRAQLTTLGKELQQRRATSRKLNGYYKGDCPFPQAVVAAQMTNAYRTLTSMSGAPWGSLVVDSVQDRLEVIGIRSEDQDAADAVWGVWQDNQMDSESKLAHNSALVDGRVFATVWPENGGAPQITLDNASQMIVQYEEGSRRRRRAALRYWEDESVPHATLYRPEAIYKFQGPKNSSGFDGTQWSRREVPGESWPLDNPFNVVNVVELAVNRRLAPGSFGHARGEFEHCLGLIDRINLLTFLGLVVAVWLGFPLRGVIGEKILRDDSGNVVPPFDASPDSVFQIENPDAKLAEYVAADRKNLSVFDELTQLAYVTKTPAHYFPMGTGLSNISADAIRALEGALHAKVSGHKGFLAEGWEEVLRLGGLMLPTPVHLSPRAELNWRDSQSRSLAERADAAAKLAPILPWQALAEKVLDATGGEIDRWSAMRSSDALTALIAGAQTPVPSAS